MSNSILQHAQIPFYGTRSEQTKETVAIIVNSQYTDVGRYI